MKKTPKKLKPTQITSPKSTLLATRQKTRTFKPMGFCSTQQLCDKKMLVIEFRYAWLVVLWMPRIKNNACDSVDCW